MTADLTQDERERIDLQLRLLSAVRVLRPVAAVPYHGHLRIAAGSAIRDLLLADVTQRSAEVTLIDWKKAPLAEAFFTCRPGEGYEIEAEGRTLTGRVLERNLLHFEAGEIVAIDGGDHLLRRNRSGSWRREPPPDRSLAKGVTRRQGVPRRADLDPDQDRAVRLPASSPVLIAGPAGSGKTTAAIQRLAAVHRERGGRRNPQRALAVVPTEGLRRMIEARLLALGLRQVEVVCYERWAMRNARRLFSGLPARLSQDAPAGVIRLKRHPALRAAIARLAEAQPGGPTRRADLQELFGDRSLLDAAVAAAQGELHAGLVDEVREHTRIQFADPAEQEFEHVMAEHLVTLDGKPIDAGTPMADASSCDPEDAAVLFELDRCRAQIAGRTARAPERVDLMLVDEVQEFAPLELALLGRALAPGGCLIAVGDEDQQLDPASGFTGFDQTLHALGAPGAARVRLQSSHRCPAEILGLARAVLAQGRLDELPRGSRIQARAHDSDCHRVAWLGDALSNAIGQDAQQRLAVVCRHAAAARGLAQALAPMLGVRLALADDLDLGPGVVITSVDAVRGLEFDQVVLPDATAAAYPDTDGDRRALYVAMTRTRAGLCLAADGLWSPLLLPACERAGLR